MLLHSLTNLRLCLIHFLKEADHLIVVIFILGPAERLLQGAHLHVFVSHNFLRDFLGIFSLKQSLNEGRQLLSNQIDVPIKTRHVFIGRICPLDQLFVVVTAQECIRIQWAEML